MAGTLEVSTIKSGAANTPPVIQDSAGNKIGELCLARGVADVNSGTALEADSFNVDAITYISAGQCTVTLTNNMTALTYSVVGNPNSATSRTITFPSRGLSTFNIVSRDSTGALSDALQVGFAVFGGK